MENESKIRLLSLCKLLYERSDEAHPLSTTQIIEILKMSIQFLLIGQPFQKMLTY